MEIANLRVRIVRYVDAHQPGWVVCEFEDAEGFTHAVVDKVPILMRENLDQGSAYPKSGLMQCEVIERWLDANGRGVARITIDRPLSNETSEGKTEFVVYAAQLSTGAGTV